MPLILLLLNHINPQTVTKNLYIRGKPRSTFSEVTSQSLPIKCAKKISRSQGVFQVRLDSGIPILGTSNLAVQITLAWEKVSIDISCIHFSFLGYKRSVQLLYETLDTLIVSLSFVDRQTNPRVKHQTTSSLRKDK